MNQVFGGGPKRPAFGSPKRILVLSCHAVLSCLTTRYFRAARLISRSSTKRPQAAPARGSLRSSVRPPNLPPVLRSCRDSSVGGDFLWCGLRPIHSSQCDVVHHGGAGESDQSRDFIHVVQVRVCPLDALQRHALSSLRPSLLNAFTSR